MKTKTPKTQTNPLVGKFFHAIDHETKQVTWQGQIIGNPEPGFYMAQLFDWLAGGRSIVKLALINSMESWLFYNNADEMKFSYEKGTARLGGPYRKQNTAKPSGHIGWDDLE